MKHQNQNRPSLFQAGCRRKRLNLALVFMATLCKRGPLYVCPVISFYLSIYLSFFSSPNLSGRRLAVYHTLTHGVALVRI